MKTFCRRTRTILLLITIVKLLFAAPAAMAEDRRSDWDFIVQPYIWFTTIEGELKYSELPSGSGGSPEISIDPEDLFEDLDAGALVTLEVRKGKWSLLADFVYMDVSSSEGAVKAVDFAGSVVSSVLNLETEVEVKSLITTFGGGYRVIDEKPVQADLIVGGRYLWLEADADWRLAADVSSPAGTQTFARSGNLSEDADVWNGIGGIRGQIQLGAGNWFIPFYADIGAGDSDLTWQVFSALAYSFKDWFSMAVGYRHLEFDSDDEDLVQELTISGPVIGARFRF